MKFHKLSIIIVITIVCSKGQERLFLPSLYLADEDLTQLQGAQFVLVDNNLLPMLIKASDSEKHRSNLNSIKWIQTTWAGVDTIFKENIGDIVKKKLLAVTRFSGSHFGQLMTEFLLAQIINYERSFYYLHSVTKVQKQW